MMKLVALDVAILPPLDIMARAMELSATLPGRPPRPSTGPGGAERLQLDSEHLPHITLTQHFVREAELTLVDSHVDEVLAGQPPLPIVVTGGGKSGHTLWMSVQRSAELLDLHDRLMEALRGVERQGGGPHAFYDGDARVRDVLWVTGFRLQASSNAFTPHITLGHGTEVPEIEPFAFEATTVAVCHLGRFGTCRRVLRAWHLVRA